MSKFPLILVLLCFWLVSGRAQEWQVVKSDARFNISGMALVAQNGRQTTLLVVHDNKDQPADAQRDAWRNKTERAGLVIVDADGLRPKYERLKWLGSDGTDKSLPVDLESVTAMPGEPNRFLALTGNPFEAPEKGRIYYLQLDAAKREIRVLRSFKVPTALEGRDFEGLAVQRFGGSLIAFWADRGRNQTPATIFWGELDSEKGAVRPLGEVRIKTAAPELADLSVYDAAVTRSISDLKVDGSGGVFVTSVFDSEDDGPFASSFYYVGAFAGRGSSLVFNPAPAPVKLSQFKNYKAEAFEFVPGKDGGVIFGSDDEEFGAAVYFNR